MKPIIYQAITDKRSLPFNSSGTGTIQTVGIAIIGTGTLFTTEMPVGSYIVDLPNWEVRKVYRVDSDTSAFMEVALTANIAPLTVPQIIKAHQTGVKEISILTNTPILIDNFAFTGLLTWSKSSDSKSQRSSLIAPVIVDATGAVAQISIIY